MPIKFASKSVRLLFSLWGMWQCTALQAQLTEWIRPEFNPGALRFYASIPPTLKSDTDVPLVLVLHGCGQDAKAIDELAGWSQLQKELPMALVFPEQVKMNNPSDCFNWFMAEDVSPGRGELASIMEALRLFRKQYPYGRNYVYGVSAGAAMALALMVNFPSTFTAGATLATGPFRLYSGLEGMRTLVARPEKTPPEVLLAWIPETLRNASIMRPLLVSVQGTSDPVVHRDQQRELKNQWTTFSSSDTLSDGCESPWNSAERVRRCQYNNERGGVVCITYLVERMGHAVPVNHERKQVAQGGGKGLFAAEAGWFSTEQILHDWGLKQ